MSKFSEKLKEEFNALLPPALFFFIALHLVAFVQSLLLKGTGIAIFTSISVTLGALIIAKAILITDLFPYINRYPDKPLIYNIAWKTTNYFLIAGLVHYLERLFDYWKKADGIIAANEKLLTEIVWPHFWAIQIFVLVLIFMYCILREFIQAIGSERARKILFGTT
jgi:hypothetical protein